MDRRMLNHGNNRPPRELFITRVLDAPQQRVFEAWTDAKQVERWWGPKGFTNPVCEIDVQPGGPLRIVMRGPDGIEYPMTGVFREVVKPRRIVFNAVAQDAGGSPLLAVRTTATFVESGQRTRLTVKASAAGLAPGASRMLAGMEVGWRQSLERLGALLAQSVDRELVSSRVIEAPRELVFDAWTDPGHLAQWWGPKGFTNTFYEFDPRPGGIWRFVMHSPEGVDYQNKHVFVEVVKPERIVLEHVSAPRFRLTATFDEEAGNTRLSWRMLFESAEDCAKVKTFAIEANEQNFDRLAAELAEMASQSQLLASAS